MTEVAQQAAPFSGAAVELGARFGSDCRIQETVDGIAQRLGARRHGCSKSCATSKNEANRPFPMLFDLSAIDERYRQHRSGQPDSDFTVFYHLISLERNEDIRIKVALSETTS